MQISPPSVVGASDTTALKKVSRRVALPRGGVVAPAGVRLRGMNLAPATNAGYTATGPNQAWSQMFIDWPWTTRVKRQVDLAKQAGANCIRLIGGLRAINDGNLTVAEYVARYEQLVAYCNSVDMYVYACGGDPQHTAAAGTIATTPNIISWLSATVEMLNRYPNVVAFDVLQEVFGMTTPFGMTRDAVEAFVATIYAAIKPLADMPITFSHTQYQANSLDLTDERIDRIIDYCDFLDFHLYWQYTEADFAPVFAAYPDKRILIGEWGHEDFTLTVNTTAGSTSVTSASANTSKLKNGQLIDGPGIQSGTRIVSGATTTTLVLSLPATLTGTGVTLNVTASRIERAEAIRALAERPEFDGALYWAVIDHPTYGFFNSAEVEYSDVAPIFRRFPVNDRTRAMGRRRALAVLATPYGGTYSNAEMSIRYPFSLPVTSRRWRMRLRNYNVLTDTPTLSGASFTASYLGRQAFDSNGAETGGFVAAPTAVLAAFTLPANGSEYVSEWVDGDAGGLQPTPGVGHLLSIGFTGGVTQQIGTNRSWFAAGAGKAALASQTAATGFASIYTAAFDIRIEYETDDAECLVVAAVGDSTTQGTGANSAIPISANRRWPEQWAQRTGNPTANGGVSSASVADTFASATAWAFQRLLPGVIHYDAVISDLGINDASAGIAVFKTNHAIHVASIRTAFGTDVRVLANGVKPYDYPTGAAGFVHGLMTSKAAIGATSILSSVSFGTGTVLRIGAGYTAEDITTTGAPTGTGPYTIPVPALTKAHEAGEVIAGSGERFRLDANDYLGSLPSGIVAFSPTQRLVQSVFDSARYDPRYSADGIHPSVQGHSVIALGIPPIQRTQ